MATLEKGFCKVYVDAPITAEELAEEISRQRGTLLPWNTVKAGSLELEVRENENFLCEWRRKHKNDFVLYRLCIDIEPNAGASWGEYVADMSFLLELLWGLGLRAVAACEFESELPKHKLGEFWAPRRKAPP